MKQKLLIGALSLGVVFASASADARVFSYSGVGCIQASGSQNSLDRTQYGVHNTSTSSSVSVECPVDISTINSPSLTIFGIQAYDRNSGSDADDDVICDLHRIDGNGNVTFTSRLKTSGSAAGPQGRTVTPSGVFAGATWRLRCSIPAAVNALNSFSHVVSYGFHTSE